MGRWIPAALLLAVLACDPTGSGCQMSPLQRDLDLSSLGHQAIEFYLPPGSGPVLSEVILDLLAEQEADRLRGSLEGLAGSLGGTMEYLTAQTDLQVGISELATQLGEGRIALDLGLEAALETLSLEVFNQGEPLRTCFVEVAIPARRLTASLIVESDYSGRLRIRVDGEPLLTDGTVATELELDCPEQPGSDLGPVVVEAVEAVYARAAEQLTLDLADAASRALGLDAGLSGSFGSPHGEESAHLMVHSGPFAEVLADTLRVGLTGGIESEQAACIPPGAAELPPASEPPADFRGSVPVTGEPYVMGISVSQGLLAQGLAAAYRGGLLCRLPSAGDLAGVDLDELFESLEGFEGLDTARAALWPGQPPALEFTNPVLQEGEMLPRAILGLPDLTVDIYILFEGADVRLLGLTADVTLKLVPVLDGENLYFWPADVTIQDLKVDFSKLLTESANPLRSSSAQALERVVRAVIENLPPIKIPRPAAAAGELLGAETSNGRLLLYFNH